MSLIGPILVKQVCSEDGIEFTLTTPEGFFGRIYTYGYYDTCFFDGRGESVSVLKVSRPDGFPRCGTIGYADYFTNIVVVQFNDFVQTGRDRKYNLTCTLYGPGETVVTSGVMSTGTVPIPLETLPAQNILASNVLLRILYKGYPVQQIAVGDPLIFRLETRRAYDYGADIFATNVIAKDPYSGRVVQLIDQAGCPVDWYIFPNLDRGRDAEGLEAQFNAFKIPDSNFLVFEATVRTCRGPCQPINCNSPGRFNVVSFGRKRRSVVSENGTVIVQEDEADDGIDQRDNSNANTTANITFDSDPEQVRELLQVYLTRADIPVNQPGAQVMDVCLSSNEYYGLVVAIGMMFIVLGIVAITSASCIRRYKLLLDKNKAADTTSPSSMSIRANNVHNHPATSPYFQSSRYIPDTRFDDPSEPIYTDPSLFERSASIRRSKVENRVVDELH
ncbi:hypothetical protein CHUAL_014226 [Chamberlinius hualienensis]